MGGSREERDCEEVEDYELFKISMGVLRVNTPINPSSEMS